MKDKTSRFLTIDFDEKQRRADVMMVAIQKLSNAQVSDILSSLHTPPLGTLHQDDEESVGKPWRRGPAALQPGGMPASIEITPADRLHIPIQAFSNQAQNRLKRIAAFSNPQFNVIYKEDFHQKYAIVDGSIGWYGSVNLLSSGASRESSMRQVSSSIARALIGNE